MTQVSCHEISSCLVDAWSSPPLAWPYSTVSPDPHCACSSSAALHAVSGVTDGKPNSMDVCRSSCMPFGWLCPPSSLLCSLALEAWLYYCLTLSPFGIFFFFFLLFSPSAFRLADKPFFLSLFCSSHAAFVLVIFAHTHTCTHTFKAPPSPSFLSFLVCSPPFCIPVSCLKTKGAGSPRAVECVEVRGRHRSTVDFSGSVAMNSTLYPHWLFSSMTNPWHTSWCQKARNSRSRDTAYNNSTHLYWFNGLKRTDQFSMLCIVGVSLCILSVYLQKIRNNLRAALSSKCLLAVFSIFVFYLFLHRLILFLFFVFVSFF